MRNFWMFTVLVIASSVPALADQNVVVVLDDSGSMNTGLRSDRRPRIKAAKEALLTVLERLPDESRLGVLVLNRGGWIIPLGPLDPQNFRSQIEQIRADGGTPLGKCIKLGADALLEARAARRYGTYKLLIVTDGEATDEHLVEAYLPDILSRGIVVDVIGVDMQQDHSLATAVHTYRRADNPASLEQAIAEVVLGESTADSRDAEESDFEWLEGLPDEVAVAALNALVETSNEPITARPVTGDASSGAVAPQQGTANVSTPARGTSRISFLSLLTTCCGIGCVGVVVLVAIGFAIASKR